MNERIKLITKFSEHSTCKNNTGTGKYREDTISEVKNVQFVINHICEVALGKFNFGEDRIEGIEENYHFPNVSNKSSGVLRDKNIYEFRIDTDGYIYGCSVSTWIGDGFRSCVWDGHLFELSEKEKKVRVRMQGDGEGAAVNERCEEGLIIFP